MDAGNDGFYRWCLTAQGLKISGDVLKMYTEEKLRELHDQLRKKCGTRICLGHTIDYKNKCAEGDCDGEPCDVKKWIKTLYQIHQNEKEVYNIRVNELVSQPKSVQLVFMGRGNKANKDPDLTGLLHFIKDCKAFHDEGNTDRKINVADFRKDQLKIINKVIELRNHVMHAYNFELTVAEKNAHFSTLKEFIRIKHFDKIPISRNESDQSPYDKLDNLDTLSRSSGSSKKHLISKLTTTVQILQGHNEYADYGCLVFEREEMAVLISKSKHENDDGWHAMKYDDMTDRDRIQLADALKELTSNISRIEYITKLMVQQMQLALPE